LSGLDSVFSFVIGVSVFGMSPPSYPSFTRMLYSLCVSPLVASTWFFYCVTGLRRAFFCLSVLFVVLPSISFVRTVYFLVFPTGVFIFCEDPSSDGLLYFFGSTRTVHSSFQYFISHCTSYVVM